ncbi:unnamed protein product [Microthlaspi erraticum]|uniref:Transmembrane protein n=1 Tax=Microthlaspi erraticum TaxID=1685480 RepID=A0A6D2HIY9_9BRAS|nr:unnamed protein product [Microthlaspi erraticum]
MRWPALSVYGDLFFLPKKPAQRRHSRLRHKLVRRQSSTVRVQPIFTVFVIAVVIIYASPAIITAIVHGESSTMMLRRRNDAGTTPDDDNTTRGQQPK